MKPRELIKIDSGIKSLSLGPDGSFLRTGLGCMAVHESDPDVV